MARAGTLSTADFDAAEMDFENELGAAEVVKSRVDLRKKVKHRPKREGDHDPVAAAEAAVGELSESFGNWMRSELDNLLDCWNRATHENYSDDSRDSLFRVAHDIKGQAATLGYPLAGVTAASLCHLLSEGPEAARLPRALVDQHVQAIRAMVREDAREGHGVARALAERLTDVTDEYLASLMRAA